LENSYLALEFLNSSGDLLSQESVPDLKCTFVTGQFPVAEKQ